MAFADKHIVAPECIRTDAFVIRPVLASDVELDYAAVMDSKESLRLWEGSTWPEDDFTVEDNLEDLVKMENRHNAGYAFGYTIMNLAETECFGCVYIMPPDAKMYDGAVITPTTDAAWSDFDVTVSFWVSEGRVADEMDREVFDTLRSWLKNDWAFGRYLIAVTELFEQQVALLEATGLELQFQVELADSDGLFVAYA